MPTPTRFHLMSRLSPVALVGMIAVVFLPSGMFAGVIGVVTTVAVLIDMIVLARTKDRCVVGGRPEQIAVDLSRRS